MDDESGERLAQDVVIREGDVEITFFKSSGPGGQHKNRRETGVRIRHLPTGLTASATEERSQARNRAKAMERLGEMLERLRRRRKRRIATRPGRAARERRLTEKRVQSDKKRSRRQSEE